MTAPIGLRTVTRSVDIKASAENIWQAVHPFGAQYAWNGAVKTVTALGEDRGHMVTGHMGRDGQPIEREFALSNQIDGQCYDLRYTDDSSLAQAFWDHHIMGARLKKLDECTTRVTFFETDRYNGAAFLIFRFFALRRTMLKLKRFCETGVFTPGGVFEKPVTQVAMAVFSALLLWPLFGLSAQGLFLSAVLTLVVAAHELGHMAAFRVAGHPSARMIFIPILGGIALGGRPYDTHFEIGFSALMGAGFSAFGVAFFALFYFISGENLAPIAGECLLALILIGAAFNLGNLIPVWKFDGGQVLRQVFRDQKMLAVASFLCLVAFGWTAFEAGLPADLIATMCGVFIILSLITAKTGVRPKTGLTPMNGLQQIAICAGFAATFSIHAILAVWAAQVLL